MSPTEADYNYQKRRDTSGSFVGQQIVLAPECGRYAYQQLKKRLNNGAE